ncbi:hypothetical protein SAMN04488033_10893 [Salegentibacter agarivorans]|uniref:Lipocalin-like domain-containing protein n=1 Tax=Salegentibacter agarivorans TaxID=345907 RepID=A0A1I2LIG6_9FLAO|nr:hypothetical protein [Salegentibacter agarivorans]SFF77247.1 hypothetical protein SAMN04488033_10893 [Salegentibacter agarivorans]
MKHYFWMLCMALCFLLSCNSDDSCENSRIAITSMEEEYACNDTRYSLDISTTEEFQLITNIAEYEDKITGTCDPTLIDFTNFDLIIGKVQLTSGNDAIDYSFIESCTEGRNLYVTFIQNDAMIAPVITYHVLVPKAEANKNIEVRIFNQRRA